MRHEEKLLRSYHFYMQEQSLEQAKRVINDENIEHAVLHEGHGFLCFVPQDYCIQNLLIRLIEAGVELEAFHPYRF